MNTILVVDDEDKIRSVYTTVLKREGFNVFGAANAEDAHSILLKNPVDLILLDINLPKIDGTTLYKLIHTFYPHAKIIVSSVYPLEDQKILVQGATDYYDKSDSIKVLLHKVKDVLKH